MGYWRAGFDLVGVDIEPMPDYPFEFVQADALEYLAKWGSHFDAIHASPPCQEFSTTSSLHSNEYPMLISPTRELLKPLGKPWVIENVQNAPLIYPIELCGTMFDLGVYRHRLFESNTYLIQPEHIPHEKNNLARLGYVPKDDEEFMTVVGHIARTPEAQRAMGIDWMKGPELAEAIPPAYTQWVGWQLIHGLTASM